MWDLASLRTQHRELLRELDRAVALEVSAATREAHVKAVNAAPKKTGKVRASIKREVARRGRGYRGRIRSAYKVTRFQEKGTRPHVIEPRNRSMLRFRVGGTLVFARRVNHPGTKPRWFMRDARNESFDLLGRRLKRRMARLGR